MVKRAIAGIVGLGSLVAANPCYDDHVKYCEEEADWQGCLNKNKGSITNQACTAWLDLHAACEPELSKPPCNEHKWTGDADLCLTKWSNPKDHSEACQAALPKEEESKEEQKLSPEAEARRKKRKAIRDKAAKQQRKEQGVEEPKKKKKKSKKQKKQEL